MTNSIITKSMTLLNIDMMTPKDDFRALTLTDDNSDHNSSNSWDRKEKFCINGRVCKSADRFGKSAMNFVKVGIKLLETIVSRKMIKAMKLNKVSKAARERGILQLSFSTGELRSNCKSREMKIIKARDGKNQKVEKRRMNERPIRVEVRYLCHIGKPPAYFIVFRRLTSSSAEGSVWDIGTMTGCSPSMTMSPSIYASGIVALL